MGKRKIATSYSNQGTEMIRVNRLLWLIQEIRNDPRQSLKSLLERASISKSQFYKDRATLADLGFVFDYKTNEGFKISEDRLSPALDLTLSDQLIVMFALGHLCSSGDGHLVARALQVGRKLAGGLEEPFRSQVLEAFDQTVIQQSYGCQPEVLSALEGAIKEGRRVQIFYDSKHSKTKDWREVDPLRLYFLQKALYLYAECPGQDPKHRTFRVNRIKKIRPTGMCFSLEPREDNFYNQLNNAFIHFMGDKTQKVQIKFPPREAEYVAETMWHHSQKLTWLDDGSLLFEVEVAEPKEVEWWAKQFQNCNTSNELKQCKSNCYSDSL